MLARRCRAGVCPGLIRYRVTAPREGALAEAATLCPTAAIVEDGTGGYRIVEESCIQCGLCRELAPAAVTVEERFAATDG